MYLPVEEISEKLTKRFIVVGPGFNSPWNNYGRWIVVGVAILVFVLLIALIALRRRKASRLAVQNQTANAQYYQGNMNYAQQGQYPQGQYPQGQYAQPPPMYPMQQTYPQTEGQYNPQANYATDENYANNNNEQFAPPPGAPAAHYKSSY